MRVVVGLLHLDELVVLAQVDRDQALAPDVLVLHDRRLLDDALLRDHEQVLRLDIVRQRDQRRDLLARHQVKQVDDCRAARSAGALRDLVSL